MSKTVQYRKKANTGRHSFRQGGQRHSLVPGDIITLPADFDLGSQADQYELIGGQRPKRVRHPPQKTLEVVRKGRKYNVVNPDNPDKPLNSEPVTKKEAAALAGNLALVESGDLKYLEWDQLVEVATAKGIEDFDDYETEEQLRQVLLAQTREDS